MAFLETIEHLPARRRPAFSHFQVLIGALYDEWAEPNTLGSRGE